jgi:hypothetical protein
MQMCVRRLGVFIAAAGACSHAFATITVTLGNVDVATSASVGRQGSSTGPLLDDPAQLNGTSGVLTLAAAVAGGPVAPGDLPTLPGTSASCRANATIRQEFISGSNGLIIVQRGSISNGFDNMDNCVGTAGGSAASRSTFTLTAATPYTLSGIAAFDNEDVSGFVRLNTALGLAIRSVFVAQNGPFSFTGTLNPGTYQFNSNCNANAIVGNAGVGPTGSFSESSSFEATLVLGVAPCDTIDFNQNGVFPEDQDVVDFFDVLAGGSCPTCNDIDFNNNGVFPEDQDVIDFFNVLAGGSCP